MKNEKAMELQAMYDMQNMENISAHSEPSADQELKQETPSVRIPSPVLTHIRK